jgi:hypothetical protein
MDSSNLTGILGVRFAHRHIGALRRVRRLLHRKRFRPRREAQTVFEEMICIRVHDSQMPRPTKRKPSNAASSGSPGGILSLIFTLRRTQSLHVSSGSGQALRVVLLECRAIAMPPADRRDLRHCSKSEIILLPCANLRNNKNGPEGLALSSVNTFRFTPLTHAAKCCFRWVMRPEGMECPE